VREIEKENKATVSVGIFYIFAECPRSGTRQRFFFNLKYSLPSALDLTLDKDVFAECRLTSTRQRSDVGFSNFFAECHL
jgi:hypothetical protein